MERFILGTWDAVNASASPSQSFPIIGVHPRRFPLPNSRHDKGKYLASGGLVGENYTSVQHRTMGDRATETWE